MVWCGLKSYQKCETVFEFELQEAEMCDSFTLLHVLSKTGTVQTQPANGGTVRKVKFQRLLREGSGEHI